MFADNNLFNPQWTTGNLSAIAPIVQLVGFFAMCLISIGGFFMVILPLMRNVINGIVVVAPNLCDKIDQAHRQKLGIKNSEGGNQIQMIVGSVMMIILSCFPNFIALSDFNEGIRDPKTFMIKAIPMMCIYVFIGVFVFYGYPAKFAEKFSNAATSAIDMALNNVDPEAWIEKIPTNLARPDFATGDATDNLGQNVNTMSKRLWGALTSKYSDMSKDNRIALSHQVEGYCNDMLAQITDKSDSGNYKLSVEARVTDYDPQLNQKAQWPSAAYDEKEHIYIYQVKGSVADNFDIGVPGGVEGDHFMCILKFYELPDKSDTASNVSCVAEVGSRQVVVRGDGKDECVWTTETGAFSLSGAVKVNGVDGKVETKSDKGKTFYVVTFDVSKDSLLKASGTTAGVYALSTTGGPHTVTKVDWTSGNSTNFNPVDSSRWNGWGIGSSPTPKKTSEVGGSSTNNDSENGRQRD